MYITSKRLTSSIIIVISTIVTSQQYCNAQDMNSENLPKDQDTPKSLPTLGIPSIPLIMAWTQRNKGPVQSGPYNITSDGAWLGSTFSKDSSEDLSNLWILLHELSQIRSKSQDKEDAEEDETSLLPNYHDAKFYPELIPSFMGSELKSSSNKQGFRQKRSLEKEGYWGANPFLFGEGKRTNMLNSLNDKDTEKLSLNDGKEDVILNERVQRNVVPQINPKQLPSDVFWNNRGRRSESNTLPKDISLPEGSFWLQRGKKPSDSLQMPNSVDVKPFWIQRGRRSDSDQQTSFYDHHNVTVTGSRQGDLITVKLTQAQNPFWLIRGKKDSGEVNPFWTSRGRRQDPSAQVVIPRGHGPDDEEKLFWTTRGKKSRFLRDSLLTNLLLKSKRGPSSLNDEQLQDFWTSRGRRAHQTDDAGPNFWTSRGKR